MDPRTSKDFLKKLKALKIFEANNIKIFHYATLFTTILNNKLVSKLVKIDSIISSMKKGNCRYRYVGLRNLDTYLVKHYPHIHKQELSEDKNAPNGLLILNVTIAYKDMRGDGLYISVTLTVRSCTICVVFTYMFLL